MLNLEELRRLSLRIPGVPSCNLLIWVGGGATMPAGVELVVDGGVTMPSQLVVSPLPGTPALSITVIDRFTLLLFAVIPEFADTWAKKKIIKIVSKKYNFCNRCSENSLV